MIPKSLVVDKNWLESSNTQGGTQEKRFVRMIRDSHDGYLCRGMNEILAIIRLIDPRAFPREYFPRKTAIHDSLPYLPILENGIVRGAKVSPLFPSSNERPS